MLSRCRSQRCIKQKNIQYNIYICYNIQYCYSDNQKQAQPQPWNIHPTPNPYDYAQRIAVHKRYASPPDPKPYKTTQPYIDYNKQHLPRYPDTKIGRQKKDKYLQQVSPLLSLEKTSDGQYLASNRDKDEGSLLLPPSYTIDQEKRKSYGIVDDEASYKGIRRKLELIIREAKSPEFQSKGLDGILSISRKFQQLLDQTMYIEAPKYAFPLFDEIFFAFQKYGIMSDRPYNQMITQCERREMNSRWYDPNFL